MAFSLEKSLNLSAYPSLPVTYSRIQKRENVRRTSSINTARFNLNVQVTIPRPVSFYKYAPCYHGAHSRIIISVDDEFFYPENSNQSLQNICDWRFTHLSHKQRAFFVRLQYRWFDMYNKQDSRSFRNCKYTFNQYHSLYPYRKTFLRSIAACIY